MTCTIYILKPKGDIKGLNIEVTPTTIQSDHQPFFVLLITLRLTTPKKRKTQIQRNLICLSSTVHRDMNKEQAISDCFYDIDVTKNLN